MNRFPRSAILSLATLLAMVSNARAQREPYIGYVYPAGGRQGTEFEVIVGGQYLVGASAVHISGEGARATVIETIKALTQQQLNELRQKLAQLERRLQSALNRRVAGGKAKNPKSRAGERPEGTSPAANGPARSLSADDLVRKIAGELGLDVASMKDVAELRKKYFDPKKQRNPQLAELVRVKVELDPDAAPGDRDLRLVSASAVSTPIRFQVSRWTEQREVEPNETGVACEVPGLPAVLNGQILPGDVDRFRFRARKGQRVVIAVSARELIPYLADAVPGWFQATLALHDARGAEVAYADDFRFHPDPVLCHELAEDGVYELEIRDAIYRGREDFVYRITLGEFPFLTSVFPLGGRVGAGADVELRGWNLPVHRLQVSAGEGGRRTQALDLREGECVSNALPFAVDTFAECLEEEPNDDETMARLVELPRIVNGRIDRPGDRDVFRFEGHAGQAIVAEVQARRLSSPVDSLLELVDASGRVLAANDDYEDRGEGLATHHADSRLQFELPSDGTYGVRLRDLQHQGGAECGYRLYIGPPRPDFDLRVVPSGIGARAGATVPITVVALRRDGFAGEIDLALKGAPPGFTLSGGCIPAGADRVRFTLTIPDGFREGPLSLSLEGEARIAGRKVCRSAVPADERMQAFSYRHLVPAKEWLIAVSGKGKSRGMRIVGDQPVRLPPGGRTQVRIAAPGIFRSKQIRLALDEPPEGISVEKTSTDRQGLSLLLRAGARVPPGLKGNLIVRAFVERDVKARERAGRAGIPIGTLPAIRFEVSQPSSRPPRESP